MGVPCSAGELIQQYSHVMLKAGGGDLTQVAEAISKSGFLKAAPEEGFELYLFRQVRRYHDYGKPPVDCDDFLQLYGDLLIKLGAKSAEHMMLRLYSRNFLENPPKKGFLAYLTRRVRQLLDEDKISEFEYPESLPANEDDLCHRYRRMVNFSLRRIIRWGLDLEDAEQEIWAKLAKAEVLKRYLQVGIFRRIPPQMTAEEAIAYLGVSEDFWYDWTSKKGAPLPVRGHWSSPKAEYNTTDIRALDESGIILSRPNPRRLPAAATDVRKFEIYLRTSVQNHARNILRTHQRRAIKDTPLKNPNVYLAGGENNYHVAYTDSEGRDSWESSLVSDRPPSDCLCDAKILADNLRSLLGTDVEGSVEDHLEVLARLVKVAKRAGLEIDSDEALAFVMALSEGQATTEATTFLNKLKARVIVHG